jgi:hypothetical protein
MAAIRTAKALCDAPGDSVIVEHRLAWLSRHRFKNGASVAF